MCYCCQSLLGVFDSNYLGKGRFILRMNRLKKKWGSNKGLSLVELLIVICIIAIIVAVVGAYLINHIEKSKIQKDVSNAGLILSTATAAANEPEIYREISHHGSGYSAEYPISENGDFPDSYNWNPLFEGTVKQNLGKGPEFAYRKNNPTNWKVKIYYNDGSGVEVTVCATTSAGDIELAPNPQAPYKK